MKCHRLLFALIATCSLAAASDPKDGLPTPAAGNVSSMPLFSALPGPNAVTTAVVGDLDGDPTFNATPPGMNTYQTNDANDATEIGLRVFPTDDGGYWLVGYHVLSGAYTTFIAKIDAYGNYDTGWGNQGRANLPVPFPIVDVAKDPGGATFYFTGAHVVPGASDTDFGVYCIDAGGSGATPCDFFGDNGLTNIAIDVNGAHNDYPVRIVATVIGELYVVGNSDTNNGTGVNWDVSVAALSGIDGTITQSFGSNGKVTHALDHVARGGDFANDIVVDENFLLPTHRIYVVGSTQHVAANDTDAFVMALSPSTGALDTTFNGTGIHEVYADLGTTNKQDMFNRVKVLRDHSVVAAGQSRDDADNEMMLVAKFTTTGTYSTSFCGAGHCIEPIYTDYVMPSGIAERANTRDLVFSLDVNTFGTVHRAQAAIEYGSSGNMQHAFNVFDYSASSGTTPYSSSIDVMIDSAGRFLIAGRRLWTTTASDYDMTLVRTLPNDTIFADGVEGN
jgi:uncharacterized delta-60 repeat protein